MVRFCLKSFTSPDLIMDLLQRRCACIQQCKTSIVIWIKPSSDYVTFHICAVLSTSGKLLFLVFFTTIADLLHRFSKNSELWPNPDPNGKPLYIPPDTWQVHLISFVTRTDCPYRIVYSVFIMQRKSEYWGPDGVQSLLSRWRWH